MSNVRFEGRSIWTTPVGVVRAAMVVALVGVSAVTPRQVSAQAPSAAASSSETQQRELPPLPEVPSASLPDPTPESVELVAKLLERLLGEDDEDRLAAANEVRSVRPDLVAAINRRIDGIAEDSDRQEMKRLLLDIRTRARDELRDRMRAAGKKGKVETPDYFDMVVTHPKLDDENWQNLVRILALSRMLTAIETVDATRALVRIYVRFDFLRIDTQLQLDKLGDKALAALIETRRHEAKKVAEWAERQLDLMGKAIPSEAVQVTDYGVLADVLRAYGRIKDPDAARIIISFANSERAQIREAARQATALMGEVGNWQLRDAYENTVGKRPPRDWDWRRTARELFAEYDRLRLAHVYDLFDKGRAAHRAGQLDEMRANYDKVLARSPMFEHRAQMAAGYYDYAVAKADVDVESAITALRRASRLTLQDDESSKRVRSLLMTLEGERLLAQGIADQELFRRAVELDPTNDRAKKSFDVAQRGEQALEDEQQRWIGAVVIGVVALMAILLIVLLPRRRDDDRESAPPEDEPPDGVVPSEPSFAAPSAATAADADADDAEPAAAEGGAEDVDAPHRATSAQPAPSSRSTDEAPEAGGTLSLEPSQSAPPPSAAPEAPPNDVATPGDATSDEAAGGDANDDTANRKDGDGEP